MEVSLLSCDRLSEAIALFASVLTYEAPSKTSLLMKAKRQILGDL